MQNRPLSILKVLTTLSVTKFSALASENISEHDEIERFFRRILRQTLTTAFFRLTDKSNLTRINSYKDTVFRLCPQITTPPNTL